MSSLINFLVRRQHVSIPNVPTSYLSRMEVLFVLLYLNIELRLLTTPRIHWTDLPVHCDMLWRIYVLCDVQRDCNGVSLEAAGKASLTLGTNFIVSA